jgi:allantoin racemase
MQTLTEAQMTRLVESVLRAAGLSQAEAAACAAASVFADLRGAATHGLVYIVPRTLESIAAGKTVSGARPTLRKETGAAALMKAAGVPGPVAGREAMLLAVRKAKEQGIGAVNMFNDTGLAEARRRARVPVLGIGEAAFHVASLVAPSFSVVTTLAVSVPIIADNIAGYGFGRQCRAVRASNVPVLALEGPGMAARDKVSAEIAAALREDGCAAIILGCAGMTDLAADLSRQHGVPVIDGVAAAVKLAEASIGFSRPA